MHELQFGVVGCGRISSRHFENILNVGGRIVAVCDSKQDRAEAISKQYGANCYTDIKDMLESEQGRMNILTICTPNGFHAQHSIEALKAGCHVVCEKPMALTAADCARMIKTAEHANRRLFVVKQNRYNPPVVMVKELIDKGALGSIFSLHLNCFWNRDRNYYIDDWKGTLDLDGGTLFTQFSHFIDLMLWFGGSVEDVHAYVANFAHKDIVDFEDEGAAIVKFQVGTLGTISFSINSHKKNMEGSLTLICERGTIKIGGQYLNEIVYHSVAGIDAIEIPIGAPPNEYGHYQGSMSNHRQVYENIVNVLTEGGRMTTVGYEGLETIDLIMKIYRSAGRHSER